MVIFIDESGTLADSKDRFVVFAGVFSKNPQSLTKLIPKARKRVPPKKKRKRERLVSEFKFRSVGDSTKERILTALASLDVKLFVLVLDKERRKIKDTPKNYGLLVFTLLKQVFKKETVDKIVIDRHFNQVEKRQELTEQLLVLCSRDIGITQVDSLTDSRVDLADFVAGAVLKNARDGVDRFKNLIEPKIVSLKVIKWRELKSGRF